MYFLMRLQWGSTVGLPNPLFLLRNSFFPQTPCGLLRTATKAIVGRPRCKTRQRWLESCHGFQVNHKEESQPPSCGLVPCNVEGARLRMKSTIHKKGEVTVEEHPDALCLIVPESCLTWLLRVWNIFGRVNNCSNCDWAKSLEHFKFNYYFCLISSIGLLSL